MSEIQPKTERNPCKKAGWLILADMLQFPATEQEVNAMAMSETDFRTYYDFR